MNRVLSFKEYNSYLREAQLDEAVITLGGRMYPNFGQVVILAGGAGSGKGFVTDNLIAVEGKTLDVDELKKLSIRSTKFSQKVKDELGVDIKDFDLKNPAMVSKLHEIVGGVYNLPNRQQRALFSSILSAHEDRKPNILFDVTLKGLGKLEEISRSVQELGYKKEDIHIVWVVNSFEVAIEQNQQRARVVPEEILIDTHEGVALTMNRILDMGRDLQRHMDGDIVLAFNRARVDSTYIQRSEEEVDASMADRKSAIPTKQRSRGAYIEEANYLHVKRKGRPQMGVAHLPRIIYNKIKSYIPVTKTW